MSHVAINLSREKRIKRLKLQTCAGFVACFALRKASQTSDRLYTHRELSLGSGTSTSMAMPAMPPSKSSSIMMAESRTLRGPCAELPTRGRTFTEAHIFQKPDVLQQALLGGLGPMSKFKFKARCSRPSARTCSITHGKLQRLYASLASHFCPRSTQMCPGWPLSVARD